jgi:hypothetical protein
MAKKADFNVADMFNDLRDKIALSTDSDSEPYIPDIIEFCYSKRYLNITDIGYDLFPMQRVILKSFYRGQRGNEHLKLTEDELDLLVQNKLDKPGGVLEKVRSDAVFRELVLVLGRRSGKDFMTSIMALYECMRLLELPTGSPFSYYGLAPGNPIFILTVATSSDQARILFTEMKDKMQTSEYFRNRIGKVESDKIWLLTPEDKRRNHELAEAGLDSARTHGSVVIMSGHSNSEGLLGKRIYCLLLDEVASFKTTGSSASGERIYSALGPATADFKAPGKYYVDFDGKKKPVLDSKIMSISSPRAEEGILYKLYCDAPKTKSRLAFRLPTWKVSKLFDEDSLRAEFKFMNPTEFAMEFGAEFSGTAGEKFIPDRYVDECIELGMEMGLDQRPVGRPGQIYYAHLDPAATSHNYALIVLHVEERIRIAMTDDGRRKREKIKLFIIDHMRLWYPSVDKAIKVSEVDDYIIDLAKRFRFALVSYDSWNSLASIQKLRSKGIPTRMTPFRKQYKMSIYNHLEHLLVNHQLALPRRGPFATQMEQELKCLKRIYSNVGFKIEPDPEAQVTTDDMCDALAGACGIAVEHTYAGYPKGGTVYLPQSPNASQPQWSIGRGSFQHAQWNILNRKFGKFG